MKKYIVTFVVAMIIGYIYGNFGNVSDFSMDYQPRGNEEHYHSRDSFRNSNDYRGRDSETSYDYRGRDSNTSYDYRSRDGAGGNDGGTSMDYRGRSSRTGRYVSR